RSSWRRPGASPSGAPDTRHNLWRKSSLSSRIHQRGVGLEQGRLCVAGTPSCMMEPETSLMTQRTRFRKKPAPEPKMMPNAMGPVLGLMAVFLLAMACMYLWTSRHAVKPASLPAAPASVRAAPAYTPKHIYSETANPSGDIAAALAQSKREHKRVLLDFGGDWCGDCQVLDLYF